MDLYDQYGPLLGGPELIKVLGFRSNAAFRRSVRLKNLGVRVFDIEGRKGKFALTQEVIEWLDQVSQGKPCEPGDKEIKHTSN